MTSKAIFVVALTTFAATVGTGGTAQADPPTQVTYQLTGAAPVADYISYELAAGQTQQAHVPLPWKTQGISNSGTATAALPLTAANMSFAFRVDNRRRTRGSM